MDDLVEKFLPRFARLGRERIRTAVHLATARPPEADLEHTVRELHGLAGEAGLLGLQAVTEHAQRAEAAAKLYARSRSEGDAAGLLDALRTLDTAIEQVAHKHGLSLDAEGG